MFVLKEKLSGLLRLSWPFVDDKQIRYLYVTYHYIEKKSETFIKIIPFKNFLKDLDLDNGISNNNLDNTDELYECNYSYNSCLSKEANEALRKNIVMPNRNLD